MKKLTAMVFGTALALSAGQTFTGVVTDSMCGADHKMMKVSPDAKCVRDCVKAGSKYALLAGNKVYLLSDQKAPEKFAAAKVKVTGTLDAKTNTIAVEKIEAAR